MMGRGSGEGAGVPSSCTHYGGMCQANTSVSWWGDVPLSLLKLLQTPLDLRLPLAQLLVFCSNPGRVGPKQQGAALGIADLLLGSLQGNL